MKTKKEIFLVPYAHLDTQWRWEFPTTINKYIKNTLEENIYLFEKYPEHRFNFTGALRYSMMKEYYPEQFNKVKTYINEGRWAFVGTCLDETDALIPSVESMIRNILYGDRWAKEYIGTSSRDYMIPDCFGFPANIPTVLAHCGIHGFSSQKLTWNSAIGIPFEIGIWKGPDGSAVVSALNPGSYGSSILLLIHRNPKRLKRLENLGKKNGIWKSFQYYGVGDIGGAPREGSVKRAISSVKHAAKKDDGLIVRQGSTNQFFSELTEEEKQRMDTYTGDLLLINHSAGTLTSAAIMKRWNRNNEQLAFAAEVAAVTALWAAGTSYPIDKIRSAWYRTIGNQMHDILPGTSTPTAYKYSHNDEIIALKTWDTILHDSALAITPYVKGEGNILLFNPLGEARRDVVDIDIREWDEQNGSQAIILNAEGKSIPVQLRKNENGTYQATFIPELKPFSWSRFSIVPNEIGNNPIFHDVVNVSIQEKCHILENSIYRVKVSESGKIESIFHKKIERELLKKPLAYEFQKERPLQYPAWNMDWKDRKEKPFFRMEGGGIVTLIENGPLRCTIRITMRYNASKFVREISLSQDSKMVEFTERINWRETGCSLKLALNVNIIKPEVTYNWETSRIKRGINNKRLFEMPSRYWVDICESNWGISIIEDSKYGYDHPFDDTLRMTLLYTPGLRPLSKYRDQQYHDWGEHTIRYGIYGHEGDFKGTDDLAKRFNQRIRSFTIVNDDSSEVKDDISLFEVSCNQLGILAVKKPEDSEGILIRLYERYGKDVDGVISFNSDILQVKEVNGLEEPISDISFNENKFTVNIRANGIRSYIVKIISLQKSKNVKQEALKLDYNCKLIGYNGESHGLFPAELTPTKIQAGPISYQLAIDEAKNSFQCNGQKIMLSENSNTLSILVNSSKDCQVSFIWQDKEGNVINQEKCHISPMTGFLGLWDTRIWETEPTHHLKNERDYIWINKCIGVEPGYINRDRLEWYSTHTHKNGKDQAYQYGYMYTLTLDIPKGANFLLLPDDNRIHIMAMTASQQFVKLKTSQNLHDKFDF